MKILIIYLLGMFFFASCDVYYEQKFLSKYEYENFSEFKNIDVFFRSNNAIFIRTPTIIDIPTSRELIYGVFFSNQDDKIVKTYSNITNVQVAMNVDTIKLQQLARKFKEYNIPRLTVDTDENVFIYLANIETIALARFSSEKGLSDYPYDRWIKLKNKWYRLKR